MLTNPSLRSFALASKFLIHFQPQEEALVKLQTSRRFVSSSTGGGQQGNVGKMRAYLHSLSTSPLLFAHMNAVAGGKWTKNT